MKLVDTTYLSQVSSFDKNEASVKFMKRVKEYQERINFEWPERIDFSFAPADCLVRIFMCLWLSLCMRVHL